MLGPGRSCQGVVCRFQGIQCFEGEVMHVVGLPLVDLLYIVYTSWGAVVGVFGCGGRVG